MLLQVLSVFEEVPTGQTWLSGISRQLSQGEAAAQAALRQYLQCAEAPADRCAKQAAKTQPVWLVCSSCTLLRCV